MDPTRDFHKVSVEGLFTVYLMVSAVQINLLSFSLQHVSRSGKFAFLMKLNFRILMTEDVLLLFWGRDFMSGFHAF